MILSGPACEHHSDPRPTARGGVVIESLEAEALAAELVLIHARDGVREVGTGREDRGVPRPHSTRLELRLPSPPDPGTPGCYECDEKVSLYLRVL